MEVKLEVKDQMSHMWKMRVIWEPDPEVVLAGGYDRHGGGCNKLDKTVASFFFFYAWLKTECADYSTE